MDLQHITRRLHEVEREIKIVRACMQAPADLNLNPDAVYQFRQRRLINLLQELATLAAERSRLEREHVETHMALHTMDVPHFCQDGVFYLPSHD